MDELTQLQEISDQLADVLHGLKSLNTGLVTLVTVQVAYYIWSELYRAWFHSKMWG